MTMMSAFRAALVAGLVCAVSPAVAEVEIQEVTSPGGQNFWLVEEPSIPIVSIELGFSGGVRTDPEDRLGVARFTAALMNEGAGDLDAVAFSNRADEVSARMGFSAGRDAFEIGASFLVETLDEASDLLALAMTSPRFDEEPVARVRAQILSKLAQDETDPNAVAGKTWFARAFPDHPYGRPGDGTSETIEAITTEDLHAAHQRLLTRQNAHVAIVGALDAETAGALVDKLFAGLPDGEKSEILATQTVPEPGVHIVEKDVPQSVAIFGHKGLRRTDPDFFAAYVMNYVLGGGGFASRLTEEVREKRGLAYSVYSYLSVMDAAELHLGGVQTANERIAESIDVIRTEWTKMAEGGLTAEDLEKAKTYLTGSFPLQFDSNAKIANYLVFAQMEDLGIDYINRRNGLIEAVTLEDTKRVAKRLLDAEALSIVVVGRPVGL